MTMLRFCSWRLCIWWMVFTKPFKYGLPLDFERFNVIREPGLFRVGWFIFVLTSDVRGI